MRGFDFTSWNGVLTSLLTLTMVMVIGVGARLLIMFTVQQRQQRMNRQINERLKTLIAAYKVLGGSFTGDLAVDPRHLRDIKAASRDADADQTSVDQDADMRTGAGSDRARRTRDTVEAALSDVFLLGTEEHVRLAEQAARDLVAGRPVYTAELVASLRDFIRSALDLDPVPGDLRIPRQGPARPSSSGARGGRSGGQGGDRDGRGGGMGGGGMGGGMGMGVGVGGMGSGRHDE
ncbi:hypothetical protein GII30_00150 [Gordonia amarae]|uniref:Uncharacterized protein n=2 Tax=Gordonia amarae TaxID=36821 RepID=G7GQ75_9ACTN|nr:hypothetical protein [Gordonia amarae]MCS3876747.1 putative membrane protein YgcG [Gordonia amarae]QHN15599.1 hypothetical protein GII35_00150 [Gordonia amarae]QHN20169.1 hypothetical protein GII34_00150 [Gordonia amarae]QHN29019.1 hypothetical protein GII32_00150 [Gordonia amarae]QHN37800.1 hypothetical protein GII30_00150 [Gordonia amarae]